MSPRKETIVEKIKKLYAKAESAKELGSIAEAEAFMAKVTELLLENSLSLEDVAFKKDEEEIICSSEDQRIYYYKDESKGFWEVDLIHTLAKHHFCKAIFTDHTNPLLRKNKIYPYVTLIGKAENIEIVKYLYDLTKRIFENLAGPVYDKEADKVIKNLKLEEYITSREEASYAFVSLIDLKLYELEQENDNLELTSVFSFSRIINSDQKAQIKANLKQRSEFWKKVKQKSIKLMHENRSLFFESFMPESYTENMVGKAQPYFIKKSALTRLGILSDKGTFIRGFLQGCVIGLNQKLQEKKKEFVNNHKNGDQVNALIRVLDQDLNNAVKKFYPNLKSLKTYQSEDQTALVEGMKAGKSVELTKGVNYESGKSVNLIS